MSALEQRLREHKLFRALPRQALSALVAGGVSARFEPGDTLMRQGEASDHVVVVVEGAVDILAETVSGEVKLATIPGVALLGEIGALADLPRTATIRAAASGTLLTIDRAIFNRVADDNPAILRDVVARLGGQIGAYNRAVALYTDALAALERDEYDEEMLGTLTNPSPELMNFSATFKSMADQIVLRQRQREEMASAAAIQRAMLPDPLPQDRPGGRVELFAAMRPAREVGGDFYDVFFLDADRLVVTVGDVSGKGVPAALFMAVCQTTLRMALREFPEELGRAIGRANDLLEAENRASMFATIFAAVVDLRSGHIRYCNCGHNPALLLRAGHGLETLQPNGTALGVIGQGDFEVAEAALRPGDRLLLYTDGVTEAHDASGTFFEEERLAGAVGKRREASLESLVDGIFAEVDAFAAGAPQHDDITCLAIAFAGAREG